MRQIKLIELRIEAFKSFVNPVTAEFEEKGGFFFLTGRNEVEPRLGANGAGKSSFWDALFWCCYGTSILGDRAAELTSWGKKRANVSAVFDIDGELHLIERQGSPEKIGLNGEPANQGNIDDLLGLSKTRFAQSVLYGQRAQMFYDLPIPARGALLDEVLDLSVWEQAAVRAGEKASLLSRDIRKAEMTLSHQEGKLAGLSDLSALQEMSDAWAAENKTRTEQLLSRMEGLDLVQSVAMAELRIAKERYVPASRTKLDATEAELRNLQHEVTKAEIRAGDHSDQEDLLKNEATCPTCLQPISKDFAHTHLIKFEADRKTAEAEAKKHKQKFDVTFAQVVKLRKEYEAAVTNAAVAAEQERAAKHKCTFLQQQIETCEAEATSLIDSRSNPYPAQIEKRIAEEASIMQSIEELATVIDHAKGELALTEYWKQEFKKVRLFRIARILLQLEVDTANAASLLGIADWKISIATETANKSGGTKYGVQIAIKSPASEGNCALPSGGEGQRIRLAIEMGLGTLIQRMSGVFYHIEMWDEPSAFLSDEGLEDLLESLSYRASSTGKAIWLTDHRTYGYNFDKVWTIVKTKDGAHIVM